MIAIEGFETGNTVGMADLCEKENKRKVSLKDSFDVKLNVPVREPLNKRYRPNKKSVSQRISPRIR